MSEKQSKKLEHKLETMNIEVTPNSTWDFESEIGEDVCVISCVHGHPNTDYLDEKFLHLGYVKTTDFLTVPNYHNVFVLGDIIAGSPARSIVLFFSQLPCVVKNILTTIENRNKPKNQKKKKLCIPKPLPFYLKGMSIQLGRKNSFGVGTGKFGALAKRKDVHLNTTTKVLTKKK